MHADDASRRATAVATDRGQARSQSGLDLCRDGRPSAKQDEIEAVPDIGLVFIDAKARAYLSITARARVMRDIAKLAQVWIKSDAVWWPGGPSDPNVCLLQIEPLTAELWDGSSSAARTIFEFAKAWLTGEEPSLGENRKVTVTL
jgi:hypothetical protein